MADIWTTEFWKATAERAIRTACQAALLVLVGDTYAYVRLDAFGIDWVRAIGFFLGGALLSILFSIAGNATSKTGPSFGNTEIVQPAVKLPNDDPTPDGKSNY
jgi:hypothetical protein